jgi:hypothetical protein
MLRRVGATSPHAPAEPHHGRHRWPARRSLRADLSPGKAKGPGQPHRLVATVRRRRGKRPVTRSHARPAHTPPGTAPRGRRCRPRRTSVAPACRPRRSISVTLARATGAPSALSTRPRNPRRTSSARSRLASSSLLKFSCGARFGLGRNSAISRPTATAPVAIRNDTRKPVHRRDRDAAHMVRGVGQHHADHGARHRRTDGPHQGVEPVRRAGLRRRDRADDQRGQRGVGEADARAQDDGDDEGLPGRAHQAEAGAVADADDQHAEDQGDLGAVLRGETGVDGGREHHRQAERRDAAGPRRPSTGRGRNRWPWAAGGAGAGRGRRRRRRRRP